MIQTKHLRSDPAEASDGTRIYIGRRYPRGVKDNTLWHERIHDLGPSLRLHEAIMRGEVSMDAYEQRFLAEMRTQPATSLLADLRRRSAAGETITLLCDHPKSLAPDRCHRFLVQALLEGRPPR